MVIAACSVRPGHFEHGFGRHLEIIATAPGARDGAREGGVVDAVPDEGPIDVDGNDFAECQPGFSVSSIRALETDNFRDLALKRGRAFRDTRHIDEPAGRGS